MTEDELVLWELYETARKNLILFYLPVVDRLAKYIARSTGRANWEDLRQDGAIGLMKAIARFDPAQGVPFRAFAKQYIRGAILDSSELTRNMTRRQEEIYRKIRRADDALIKVLRRNPTIEEIAEKTQLTIEQIQNALDARGVAYAGEFPDNETLSVFGRSDNPRPESSILIEEALSQLSETEQAIVRLYYLEDQSHEKIAEKLEIIPIEVTKVRQRAIGRVAKICQRAKDKLRKQLEVKEKGGHDENGRSGK
jgi:RNA polymerase sigma factor (sigma-70 family)